MSERIAKVIARAGICSRRDAEKLIAAGRGKVDGNIIDSPALNVTEKNSIEVDGKLIGREKTRLFIFHKPKGVITSHRDEKGRQTLFEILPKTLPRLISIGRLDFNTEGLILLTNNGELAHKLELPTNKFLRKYRARVFGQPDEKKLKSLKNGVTIDGINYGSVIAEIDGGKELPSLRPTNFWIVFSISEGKNREIRKISEYIGLTVNRLIRVEYGPFKLGSLEAGQIIEVNDKEIKKLGEFL